jgi:hypothetical protein
MLRTEMKLFLQFTLGRPTRFGVCCHIPFYIKATITVDANLNEYFNMYLQNCTEHWSVPLAFRNFAAQVTNTGDRVGWLCFCSENRILGAQARVAHVGRNKLKQQNFGLVGLRKDTRQTKAGMATWEVPNIKVSSWGFKNSGQEIQGYLFKSN